jgi:hypothetical protein
VRSAPIARIRDLAAASQPVTLLLYWGCFASDEAGPPELDFVTYVNSLRSIIEEFSGVQCRTQALFTDTHAKLNGVDEERIESYWKSSTFLVQKAGWKMSRLSNVIAHDQARGVSALIDDFPRERELLLNQALKIHPPDIAADMADLYLQSNLIESAMVFRSFPSAIFLHSGMTELKTLLPSMPMFYSFTGARKKIKKPWFVERKEETF